LVKCTQVLYHFWFCSSHLNLELTTHCIESRFSSSYRRLLIIIGIVVLIYSIMDCHISSCILTIQNVIWITSSVTTIIFGVLNRVSNIKRC
jgi:hypothetical protein